MTQLAAAPIPDMHKIQGMLQHDATEVLCCGSHQSSHAMSRNAFLKEVLPCAVRRGTLHLNVIASKCDVIMNVCDQ